MKRTLIRKQGKSEVAQAKRRIQALLRAVVMKRDGGCILRRYKQAGQCGGYGSKSGKLILQAEHLNTRERNFSYGDSRNVVCLCLRHHTFFKRQHGALYWDLVRKHIGEKRWKWLQRVLLDRRTYRMGIYEWNKVEIGLQQELNNLTSK